SGTRVESWGGPQIDSETTRGLLARVGNDPQDAAGDRVTTTLVSVPSGETVPLLDLRGEGSIRSVRVVMDPWTPDTFRHGTIRMSWDDHPASVDMPIGAFFGGGGDAIGAADVSTRTLKTAFFGFDGTSGEFYSYWPMPFWSRARIEIINDATVDVDVRMEAKYRKSPPGEYRRESAGYL